MFQLNQNLNDVLVDLEKEHGTSTYPVKAQPRLVNADQLLFIKEYDRITLHRGKMGLQCLDVFYSTSVCSPHSLGLAGDSSA